jgi:hypothetical protein
VIDGWCWGWTQVSGKWVLVFCFDHHCYFSLHGAYLLGAQQVFAE